MKVRILKISDWSFKEIRNGQTAEDILNLMSEFNSAIIINRPPTFDDSVQDCDYDVTIYDDYVE